MPGFYMDNGQNSLLGNKTPVSVHSKFLHKPRTISLQTFTGHICQTQYQFHKPKGFFLFFFCFFLLSLHSFLDSLFFAATQYLMLLVLFDIFTTKHILGLRFISHILLHTLQIFSAFIFTCNVYDFNFFCVCVRVNRTGLRNQDVL